MEYKPGFTGGLQIKNEIANVYVFCAARKWARGSAGVLSLALKYDRYTLRTKPRRDTAFLNIISID